jgi:hypothetical protein
MKTQKEIIKENNKKVRKSNKRLKSIFGLKGLEK